MTLKRGSSIELIGSPIDQNPPPNTERVVISRGPAGVFARISRSSKGAVVKPVNRRIMRVGPSERNEHTIGIGKMDEITFVWEENEPGMGQRTQQITISVKVEKVEG